MAEKFTPNLMAVLILAFPSFANAEMAGGMFMQHNGSTIQEFSELNSNKVEYRYAGARSGVPIQEGAVLFRGTKMQRRKREGFAYNLQGTAFVFKKGCSSVGYDVIGEQTNTRVTLKGAAPIRAKGTSCEVAGYDQHDKNATLIFDIAE